MIHSKGRRALAIGFAVCNIGCAQGVYNNKDARSSFERPGNDCGAVLEKSNKEWKDAFEEVSKAHMDTMDRVHERTMECYDERGKERDEAHERAMECYGKVGEVQEELLAFLGSNALLNNPLYRPADKEAVEKTLEAIIGKPPGKAPKTSETLLTVYDWVSVRIGVDKENDGMMYPADSLESRFANRPSRLVLLAAMLEGVFPSSTRMNEAHMRKTADISLEFDIRSIEGMPYGAAGAEKALAWTVSRRYGISIPSAMAGMKGALRADKEGLWITLDPGMGRENGLKRDDGTRAIGAIPGHGKPS